MKKEIFKKAHNLTKSIIKKGDNYRATFKLALSFVYSQIKKGVSSMKKTVEEVLVNNGYKVWEGYGRKRIYINDFVELASKLNVDLREDKEYRRISMYYDLNDNKFYVKNEPKWSDKVDEVISVIRNA